MLVLAPPGGPGNPATLRDAEATLRLRPASNQAREVLFQQHRNSGAYDAALADLDAEERYEPLFDRSWQRAAIYLRQYRLGAALQIYTANFVRVLRARELGRRLQDAGRAFDRGDLKATLAADDRALAIDPANLYAQMQRAQAYAYFGQLERAIAEYRRLIARYPYYGRLYEDLGHAEFRLLHMEEAVQDYNTAIARSDEPGPSRYRRGIAEYALGRYAAARADFAAPLPEGRYGLYQAIWQHLVSAELHQDDATALAAQLEKFPAEVWPQPVLAYLAGRITAAELGQAEARAKSPPNPPRRICTTDSYPGLELLSRGQTGAAVPYLQAAILHCPQWSDEYTMAKWTLQQIGRPKDAAEADLDR